MRCPLFLYLYKKQTAPRTGGASANRKQVCICTHLALSLGYVSEENIAAEYRSFEMPDIRQLPTLLQQTPDLCGFNVTIPHKQNILPFLDEISEEARVIGAVNCVKVSHPNGHPYLVGYNTDMYGFRKALLEFIPAAISKALIRGNGGAE